VGDVDWAKHTKELRQREANYFLEVSRATATNDARLRIAFFNLHQSSPIDYGLATALRFRGHDILGVRCDGLLPLCELNLGPNVRPKCEACTMALARREDAFGCNYERLTDYLTAGDRAAAEEIVESSKAERRLDLSVDGIRVGRLAKRELQRYYRGFVFDPQNDPAFAKWLVSSILLTWLSTRWLDRHEPDILIMCSGRTLPMATAYEVARQRGLRVVTWDGTPTFPDGLVFSHGQPATEVPLDEAWARYSSQPLSPAARRRLLQFMSAWERSENTPFRYSGHTVQDAAELRQRLALRSGVPIVAAFANTCWDIAVIDRDVGFKSMFAWLFDVADYALANPEVDVVVRAHPAETNVPRDLRTRTPVCAEVRRHLRRVPRNLKLVEGDDPINSYVLAGVADVNMVYASRFGLELAMRGRRPWLAGDVAYRGRGFTRDLSSREDMLSRLGRAPGCELLTEADVAMAERFAYLWFFRYEIRLPLLRAPKNAVRLRSFEQLGPNGDPVLSRICDAIVSGAPFVDLGSVPPS
jgi:hypothetical protein